MTPEELEEIKKRAEEATPGPWELDGTDICRGIEIIARGIVPPDGKDFPLKTIMQRAFKDLPFITHAREDVPELVAEITRLRRVLMNIESAKRLHDGIPWEAMATTLQDIARNGLK